MMRFSENCGKRMLHRETYWLSGKTINSCDRSPQLQYWLFVESLCFQKWLCKLIFVRARLFQKLTQFWVENFTAFAFQRILCIVLWNPFWCSIVVNIDQILRNTFACFNYLKFVKRKPDSTSIRLIETNKNLSNIKRIQISNHIRKPSISICIMRRPANLNDKNSIRQIANEQISAGKRQIRYTRALELFIFGIMQKRYGFPVRLWR